MKKIKKITVKVTYWVTLKDIDVQGDSPFPEKVIKEIKQITESGREIKDCSTICVNAQDWLTRNIQERDAYSWKHEIQEFESDDITEQDNPTTINTSLSTLYRNRNKKTP